MSQEHQTNAKGQMFTESQWRKGLEDTFDKLTIPKANIVVIGNVPHLPVSGPVCLSQHLIDVQQCSARPDEITSSYDTADKEAVTSVGGRYIDTTPWFCSTTCTAVIGKYEVYINQGHVTKVYIILPRARHGTGAGPRTGALSGRRDAGGSSTGIVADVTQCSPKIWFPVISR